MAEAGSLPLANMLHHSQLRRMHTDGGGDGATHLETAQRGHPDLGCLLNKADK